jgi:hypothetical protein
MGTSCATASSTLAQRVTVEVLELPAASNVVQVSAIWVLSKEQVVIVSTAAGVPVLTSRVWVANRRQGGTGDCSPEGASDPQAPKATRTASANGPHAETLSGSTRIARAMSAVHFGRLRAQL